MLNHSIISKNAKNVEKSSRPFTTDNFYVYYLRDGNWIYERTCGTKYAANDRLQELLKFHNRVAWYKNYALPGAYY